MLHANERYYSVAEVARMLGVTRCRVHQLIADRRLETRRIANLIVLPEAEVNRLIGEPRRPGRPKCL